MRLLLDTHIFLWCIKGDRRLKKSVRSMIVEADEVYVSAASIWEMAIKIRLGKLELDVGLDQLIAELFASGFLELPVTIKHTIGVSALPPYHSDPFDRLLLSQALSEPLRFLTADQMLQCYSDLVEVV